VDVLIPTPADLAAVEAINAGQTHVRMEPIMATDERLVFPAYLLADCDTGQTWAAYGPLLWGMARADIPVETDV
jgi:hypothetical protein